LIAGLKMRGYIARHIAQEHSFVPDMWQKLAKPEKLIYLDVSYAVSMQRRPLDMTRNEFEEQNRRLAHARQHADFYLHTDPLTPAEVLNRVSEYLQK
jgi:thymidylate kinase